MTHYPDFRERYGAWALVVGASEGLGEALAVDLARRRMNLALVARGAEKLKATASRIASEYGVDIVTIPADLSEPDVLDKIVAGLGGREVSFIIYNCAAENGGEFLDQDLTRHLANIQVNCIAPTVLVHHFGKEMVARGRGGIVLCSSIAGLQGLYAWASYGASKSYEMILGEGLWYELRQKGVDATSLMMGATYTPNFQRSQLARGATFADAREPENLPAGTRAPQLPTAASASLFSQIEVEWIPLIYANPEDEQAISGASVLPKKDRVLMASDPMRASYAD